MSAVENTPNSGYLNIFAPANLESRFGEGEMRGIGLVVLKPYMGASTGDELLHVIDDLLLDVPGTEVLCIVSIDFSQNDKTSLGKRIWDRAYASVFNVKPEAASARLLNSSIETNLFMTDFMFVGNRELSEEELVRLLESFKSEYRARMRGPKDMDPREMKNLEEIAKMSDQAYEVYARIAMANRIHSANIGEAMDIARIIDEENSDISLVTALTRILRG